MICKISGFFVFVRVRKEKKVVVPLGVYVVDGDLGSLVKIIKIIKKVLFVFIKLKNKLKGKKEKRGRD